MKELSFGEFEGSFHLGVSPKTKQYFIIFKAKIMFKEEEREITIPLVKEAIIDILHRADSYEKKGYVEKPLEAEYE